MARFAAVWTNTDKGAFETAPRYLVTTAWRDNVGQNIEYLAQTHNHDGGDGDGAILWIQQPVRILYLL